MKEIVIKYCIYEYNDFGALYSLISDSKQKLLPESDELTFECEQEKIEESGIEWQLQSTFFAVSPMIRPIPAGMNLYSILYSLSRPFGILSVDLVYDIYNLYDDRLYLLAYSLPVPNTRPLYLYSRGNSVYPSFNDKAPDDGSLWEHLDISPIYVIIGDHGRLQSKDIRFTCMEGRCIPSFMPTADKLENCIVKCNLIDPPKNMSILNIVKKLKNFPLITSQSISSRDIINGENELVDNTCTNKYYYIVSFCAIIILFCLIFFEIALRNLLVIK